MTLLRANVDPVGSGPALQTGRQQHPGPTAKGATALDRVLR